MKRGKVLVLVGAIGNSGEFHYELGTLVNSTTKMVSLDGFLGGLFARYPGTILPSMSLGYRC